ncbi:MAG: M64 family metallopeptidase [Mycobacteriales bacterium]
MTTSDGYIAGVHKIVDHGPDTQRYNIVILGDGYRSAEMAKFAGDVNTFTDTLRATAPYTTLWCALNVHRVDVVSSDSGADDPGTCDDGSTGSGATPKTYLDATFCGDGKVRRLLTCDATSAKAVAKAQVSKVQMTMVIVNTAEYGGSGGAVATFSTHPSSAEIGLHEMGHTAFGFADEYEYRQGCGSGESGHDSYSGIEPPEPNITANTSKTTIKWKTQLTNSADALPTTANTNCAACDPQANPNAASYVGAYEGAGYFHCKLYRPQFTCRMRALSNPFCGVCQAVIRQALAPFVPAESLTLTTPSVAFTNIPAGLGGTGVTTYRAVVFEVITCNTRTFRITSGPTGGFGTPLGTTTSVSANDADPVAEARLWVSYTSTTAGAHRSGNVHIRCDETGQTWVVNIVANTVARPKAAVALVLDRSGSMADDAGGGTSKVGKLREAANIFVAAMLAGDGVGIVRFNDTAQTVMPVTDVGPPTIGGGRVAASGHINGSELDPGGNTSIGAGVQKGKQTLDAAQASATPPYDVTSMLVLTDGLENTAPMLAAVGGSIAANTFAIGLGTPENISVAALNTLTQGHHGYLLVTGGLTQDQAARLDKYFLQVLAGVTNANVVLDPHGDLAVGTVHRIPFPVSETDFGLDVFLLTPYPPYIVFDLETPDGTLITPASAAGPANVGFVPAGNLAYYRLSLPAFPAAADGSHAGTWNALLGIGGRGGQESREYLAAASALRDGSLPYDLIVHCYSNLLFEVQATQASLEPGATVMLNASLREYDVPVDHRAGVWAQVTRPDASSVSMALDESEPGRFTGSLATTLTGLYTMRIRAVGSTFHGTPFAREQTLTAAVWPGGDRAPVGDGESAWCNVVSCLLSDGVIDEALQRRLREAGFDVRALARCLAKHCAGTGPGAEGATPQLTGRDQLSEVIERVLTELSTH